MAARTDALGQLARLFQRMERAVSAREQWLKQEVQELHIVIDEARQAKQIAEITDEMMKLASSNIFALRYPDHPLTAQLVES